MSDLESIFMPSGRLLKRGMLLRHFKGNTYQIISFAKHSETLDLLVIYKSLISSEIWARPFLMFDAKVDRKKYPEVYQDYKFEIEVI